jgi:VCBS repeat-containing protein
MRNIRMLSAVAAFAFATAALLLGQVADTTQPTVAISSPVEDSGVSGVVTVRATAADNVGVAGVQFLVDLADYGLEDTVAPFEIEWDADLSGSGAHTLSAIARDAAGNVAASDLVVVVVCGANVQPCPGTAPPPPANRPPVATGDALSTDQGVAVTFTGAQLLANDTDPDNNPLAIVSVASTSSQGGTIVANADGSWTYTPAAAFTGTDSFSYTISDGSATASAAVTVTVSAPPPPPVSALVAHYTFDESDATRVVDMSGRGNDGVISGAVRVAGVSGNALRFDGVNDWVTVADAASLDLTTAMTIEAWVNPASQSGNWRTVVMKERTGGLIYSLYAYDGAPLAGGTNRPAGYARVGGGDQAVRGPATLPLNTWSHIAVTFDGSSMRFYVGGAQVASRTLSGTIAVSGQPLRLGGNSVWGEFFNGMLDEVRVYNRALSAAEIQADMNGTPPPPPVNQAPTAVADSLTTTADSAASFTSAFLLSNDSDPDGDALTVTSVASSTTNGGTVTSGAAGSWTYTPAAGFAGTDSFTYVVNDGRDGTSTGTVSVTVTAHVPPPPAGAGLVLAMGFDELAGATTVADASGFGNTGTVREAQFVPGRFGNALSFDGVNDWVTVADADSLDLSSAMTLEAWVFPTVRSGYHTVLLKEAGTNSVYEMYTNNPEVSRPAAFFTTTGGALRQINGTLALPLNTWTHLAVTYDGTTMVMYVNGTAVRSALRSGTIQGSTGVLHLGGNAVWGGEFFGGLLDEVRIYNRALSAEEIQADMNTPIRP